MRCCAAGPERRAARLAGLLVVPALAVHLLPRVGEALVFDRTAILAGEHWRLLTGHWVHFSASHLLWDTAVVGAAAWIAGRRGYRLLPLCLVVALAISLGILTLQPGLTRYGGLSGIAMAGTMFLAVRGLWEERPWRDVCAWALLATAVKLGVELWTGAAPVVRLPAELRPVPLSHALGAAIGALAGLWSGPRRRGAGPAEGYQSLPRSSGV